MSTVSTAAGDSTVSTSVGGTGDGSGGESSISTEAMSSMGGSATTGASGSGGTSAEGDIAWTDADGLWTGVRYYSGSTPSNRTSGPAEGPTREYTLTNTSGVEVQVDVSVAGPDAQYFGLDKPGAATVAAGGTLTVTLSLETDNAALPPAPAQDDGATVFEAELVATVGSVSANVRLYALVLTYVELEPTFGQLMDAFPYEVDLGDALENDANPDPATLPGVEPGTDEVAAPTFQLANASEPARMIPLARFSPPGEVPYGWYTPGNPGQSTVVGVLADQTDPHTNNKSRMLNPPLSQGMLEFDPGASAFSIFMEPDGQATIHSEDGQNSDGQHRLKVFAVHDSEGTLLPDTYLLGGEEASNGDYQDYVFLLTNVAVP